MTPTNPMVIDRARLTSLRRATGLSQVDRAILRKIRERGENARILVLRAADANGRQLWQFDPALSEDELPQAGLTVSRALLDFHRELLASGVMLMVHTDWGLAESTALRHGVRALKAEVEHGPADSKAVDLWVLHNMLLHVALSFDHVVHKLLPRHLALVERRVPQVQRLLAQPRAI